MESSNKESPKIGDQPTVDQLPVIDASHRTSGARFSGNVVFYAGVLGVGHAGGIGGVVTGIALGVAFYSPLAVILGGVFGYTFGFFIAFFVACLIFPICWIINASMKFVVGPQSASAIAGGVTGYSVGQMLLLSLIGDETFYTALWNDPEVLIVMCWTTLATACGIVGGYLCARRYSNYDGLLRRQNVGKHRFHFDLHQILVATVWIAVGTLIIKNYPVSLAAIVWFAVCQSIAAVLTWVWLYVRQIFFPFDRRSQKTGFLSGSGSHSSGSAEPERPVENHWF